MVVHLVLTFINTIIVSKMHFIFLIMLSLALTNGGDISEIISKFDEDKCIEDDLSDVELYSHLSESLQDVINWKESSTSKNSLSLIHELAQLNKVEYYYYLEKDEGPAHEKIFYISLTLGNEFYKGDGMSMKEAKRHAAEQALLNTKYMIPQRKESYDDSKIPPTVVLNNVATKFGMTVTYLSEDELIAENLIHKQKTITIPDEKSYNTHLNKLNYSIHHPYETKKLDVPKENQQGRQFKVGVVVGGKRFIGIGYTLQSAKHDAALHALAELKKWSVEDIEQCIEEGEICNQENNKSPISTLYEMAQARNVNLNFEVVDESGPAHERTFVTRCQFGDLTVEGSGKSKKKSKRNASENMLEILKESTTSDFDSVLAASQMSKKKKKRKKKLIKNAFEKFALDAKNFVTSSWDYVFPDDEDKDDDNQDSKSKKKKQKYSNDKKTTDYKQILLSFSQGKGISTQLVDLGIEKSKHYSLAIIGLEPKHVCLGEGHSYDLSQQKASLEALNFFHKLGILGLIPGDETFESIKNVDFGKMYIIGSDTVEDDTSGRKQ